MQGVEFQVVSVSVQLVCPACYQHLLALCMMYDRDGVEMVAVNGCDAMLLSFGDDGAQTHAALSACLSVALLADVLIWNYQALTRT